MTAQKKKREVVAVAPSRASYQSETKRRKAEVHRLAKTQPAHNITSRAMLVDLTVHQWEPTTVDKQASQKVADTYASMEYMGRYQKHLIDKEALKELISIRAALRAEHWYRTLPWRDGGVRILSSAGYFEYQKAMLKLKGEYDRVAAEFLDNYKTHIASAKKTLGALFNEAEYPPIHLLKEKFGVVITVLPVPAGEDFRVDLGDEETARVQNEIAAGAQQTIDAAMKDVWTRLHTVVQKAADKLKAYAVVDGKVENGFRDSLINNIVELLDIVPTLNITGDESLITLANEIRSQVTAHTPEVLRDDEKIRKGVAAAADDILSKMQGFLA